MMNRVWIVFLAVISCSASASAFSITMNVYGNVYNTDGTPLVGVRVQAWINGTERWTISNVTTDNYGPGYESYFLLDVQGDTNEQGLLVSFTVQGVTAVQSVFFTPQASVNLNLTPQSYIQPELIPTMTSSSTTTSTVPQTTILTTSSSTSTTTSTTSVTQVTTVAATSTTTQPASSTTVAASTIALSTSQLQTATSTLLRLSSTTLRAREDTGGVSLRTYLPYFAIGGIVIVILFVVLVIVFLLLKQ